MSSEFSIDIGSVSRRYHLPENTLACTEKYNQSGIAGLIYIVVNAFKYLLSDSLAQSDWQKAKKTLKEQITATLTTKHIETDPERITRLADRILYSLTYPRYKCSTIKDIGLYENNAPIGELERNALHNDLNPASPYLHMNPQTVLGSRKSFNVSPDEEGLYEIKEVADADEIDAESDGSDDMDELASVSLNNSSASLSDLPPSSSLGSRYASEGEEDQDPTLGVRTRPVRTGHSGDSASGNENRATSSTSSKSLTPEADGFVLTSTSSSAVPSRSSSAAPCSSVSVTKSKKGLMDSLSAFFTS